MCHPAPETGLGCGVFTSAGGTGLCDSRGAGAVLAPAKGVQVSQLLLQCATNLTCNATGPAARLGMVLECLPSLCSCSVDADTAGRA